VYNIILKPKKWMIINYVVNATWTTHSWFYIFKGERICDDYIQFCKLRICMAMQSKAWITIFFFKEFLSFFKRFILSGISPTNKHLFILDGHGSHVNMRQLNKLKNLGWIWLFYLHIHLVHFSPWMWFVSSLSRLFSKRKETHLELHRTT